MPSSALLSVLYLARNGCENVDEQQAHHKYEDKSEIILKKGGEGGGKEKKWKRTSRETTWRKARVGMIVLCEWENLSRRKKNESSVIL